MASHADHAAVIAAIRALEKEFSRPIDDPVPTCRGPSCASARSPAARRDLATAAAFTLDRDETPGDATRVVPAAPRDVRRCSHKGQRLLINDGKLVLAGDRGRRRTRSSTTVEVGGAISNNKGLNVPDVVCRSPR